jgi:hypothetical protein
MACKDCEQGNPVTPIYSGAKYLQNGNCANPTCPTVYIPPEGSGRGGRIPVNLIAGEDIMIENFSDASNYTFRISYDPFIALTANLSITGYVGGLLQSEPILKGKIVDEIRSAWSYNKYVAFQELNGIAVTAQDRAKIETGLNVTDDIIYEIEGNDGQGVTGSIATDTDSILFGNYLITGDYTNMLNQPVSQIPTLISNLANKNTEVRRNRTVSVFATGSTNRKFFIIYPASWGLGTFTKGIFEGGFQRLKNQAGTLVVNVTGTELPITWSNEEGYSEEFYIYQSLYDNTEDAVEPIIIS